MTVRFDSPELAPLLGEDDGAAIAVLYGSELIGSLDGCGCMGNTDLGGMPYRAAYTEAFRARYPGIAVLQVDVGYSMREITNRDDKVVPDFTMANDWVLKAFDELEFDAVNISYHDLPMFRRYLASDRRTAAVDELPILDRCISANVVPVEPGQTAPRPFVVRELESGRLASGSVKVALLGVTENGTNRPEQSGYRIEDPVEALTRTIPEARRESDLLIVLAYLSPAMVERLRARFGNEVALFVSANSITLDQPKPRDGPGAVAYSYYKTQSLGESRLHFGAGELSRVGHRHVTMDEPIPRHQETVGLVEAAKEAIREVRERRLAGSP